MFIPTESQKQFLELNVFPEMKIEKVTDENIDDVYDFLIERFELPLTEDDNLAELSTIYELMQDMSKSMVWN